MQSIDYYRIKSCPIFKNYVWWRTLHLYEESQHFDGTQSSFLVLCLLFSLSLGSCFIKGRGGSSCFFPCFFVCDFFSSWFFFMSVFFRSRFYILVFFMFLSFVLHLSVFFFVFLFFFSVLSLLSFLSYLFSFLFLLVTVFWGEGVFIVFFALILCSCFFLRPWILFCFCLFICFSISPFCSWFLYMFRKWYNPNSIHVYWKQCKIYRWICNF